MTRYDDRRETTAWRLRAWRVVCNIGIREYVNIHHVIKLAAHTACWYTIMRGSVQHSRRSSALTVAAGSEAKDVLRRIYRASKPPSLVRRKTGRLPYRHTTTCHTWWSMTPPRERIVRVREIGSENLFAPSHGRPTPRWEYGIVRVTACVEIANGEGFSALKLWVFGLSRVAFRLKIWIYRTLIRVHFK